MDGFSKGQKRIAAYILENYDKAAFMTASRLGNLVGVSESTVVRFASELGYGGYPSMQRALQDMIRSRLTSTQRIQAAGNMFSGQDVLPAVLQSDIDKLRQMLGRMDRSEFDRVVDRITAGRHIYILGVRSSSFVAGYHVSLSRFSAIQLTRGTTTSSRSSGVSVLNMNCSSRFSMSGRVAIVLMRCAKSRVGETTTSLPSFLSRKTSSSESALLMM